MPLMSDVGLPLAPSRTTPRDLPLDFLRGVAIFSMVVDHLAFVSPYSYVTRERVGIVSGAEVFVLISALLVGQIYRAKIARLGFLPAMSAMLRRMLTLYCVYVCITLAVFLISLIPGFNTQLVTPWGMMNLREAIHFVGVFRTILHVFVLKIGPLRMNVIGMYVALFSFAPLVLRALCKGRVKTLFAISGGLWLLNLNHEWRTIHTLFDNVFRILSWQFLFVIGVTAGFYRERISAFIHSRRGRWAVGAAVLLSLALCFFALHDPSPDTLDDLGHKTALHVLPRAFVERAYDDAFSRKVMAPGRLVNLLCLFLTAYLLLKRYWAVIERAFGWYFLVLGQSSLYVYIVHAVLLQFVYQATLFDHGNLWINFCAATGVLILLWMMTKQRVLFWLIPR